jgi:hypothetical protein
MSKKKRKNRSRKYNKNFQLLSYNITEEPVEDKYTKQIPKKIIDQIQDFQEKINLKPKEMIPQLLGYTKKVPGILNHKLDLKLMYPERSTFHISEFVGFTSIMCKYYNAVGERKAAELLFKNLEQIAPEHAATKQIKRVLYPSLIGRIFNKFRKE